MNLHRWIPCIFVLVLSTACAGNQHPAGVAPTFTPASTVSGLRLPSPAASGAVVRPDCLRSLSSYRFAGSFTLKSASPSATVSSATGTGATGTATTGGLPAGSLANLIGDVSFQGEALAPDRYHATITFGGSGTQNLEIVRVGSQSFSRFGNAAWQTGDQSAELGGIGQLDPDTLCERSLVQLTASGQTPEHESVNGIASLRYDVTGPQAGRVFGAGSAGRTPTPATGISQPNATVWVAEKGRYPVRFIIAGTSDAASLNLRLDISDVNGKDIRINPPA